MSRDARGLGLAVLNRSAMRVCHPGPVARQRATTSAGRRNEMSWRGDSDRGRPPLLTTALANISSVSSGSSSYSARAMRCASTRGRSDFEVRRETGLFTGIGLTHAEDVANCATRRTAHHHDPALEHAIADDATLAAILASVIDRRRERGPNVRHERRPRAIALGCSSRWNG